MPQVQVIQPIQQQPKRLRVAAYARVSSDSEDQLNSLAVQVDYYTHLIQENPNWEFAGIYTDEGITGTSTKRREQFNRLISGSVGFKRLNFPLSISTFCDLMPYSSASAKSIRTTGISCILIATAISCGVLSIFMVCLLKIPAPQSRGGHLARQRIS